MTPDDATRHPEACTCESCERMGTKRMFAMLAVYAIVTIMAVIVALWLAGG